MKRKTFEESYDILLASIMICQPLEINHPENGFAGYMLRCKAVPEEDCTKSLIVRKPGTEELLNEPLPADSKGRVAIRKEWHPECQKHKKFAAFLVDYCEEACISPEEYAMAFETYRLGVAEFHEDKLTSDILHVCLNTLPSYDAFAAVIHGGQAAVGDNGNILTRPPHYHILLSCDKRRSKEEINNIRIG